MTTLIFIENVLGSGQLVKLTEDFGDYSVSSQLRPGENARIVVSPFKSISVEETASTVTGERASFGESRRIAAGLAPDVPMRRVS